jgi:hypothetical protein
MMDERDFFAFQITTIFLKQVFNGNARTRPVIGWIVEDPFKDCSIGD